MTAIAKQEGAKRMSDHITALPSSQQVSRQRPWPVIVALIAWTATTIALTMLKAFYRIGYLGDPDKIVG